MCTGAAQALKLASHRFVNAPNLTKAMPGREQWQAMLLLSSQQRVVEECQLSCCASQRPALSDIAKQASFRTILGPGAAMRGLQASAACAHCHRCVGQRSKHAPQAAKLRTQGLCDTLITNQASVSASGASLLTFSPNCQLARFHRSGHVRFIYMD